ncbi:MAG TPA: LysR family transcriptional regulator [Burkholderiales bacterium]|nr:LysR family transcriptional regulator [Burkholderiales bacterium]
MLSLKRLNAFVILAEELHFGHAAARLNLTQPPLTLAIKELELEMGALLFERTKRSVRLTAAGAALLPEARALLAQGERLPSIAQAAAAGVAGELKLAFVSIVDYSFLPDLLREYARSFPGVRVQLREATTDVQLEDLLQRRIDIGILLGPIAEALPRAADVEQLEYRRLTVEDLAIALPEGHPKAAASGPLALAGLAQEPLVCIPRQVAPRLYDAILGACAAAGFSPRIAQEAIQMQTIISLVSAGIGIALVPQSIMSLRRPGVRYRKLRAPAVSKRAGARPALEVGLAWRRDHVTPVLERFIELAAQFRT